MLTIKEFFAACTGVWTTERIYHSVLTGQIERSYTEYRVEPLTESDKQQILSISSLTGIKVDTSKLTHEEAVWPGFTISFNTVSETGERVAMTLKALFVPDVYVTSAETTVGVNTPLEPIPANLPVSVPLVPIASHVAPTEEVIQGYYLRDEGYSEAGAVAGRFTYQPTRQTLEMTTFYGRSVAVDQMRIVAPDMRLRTILTYKRPSAEEVPSVIDLVGFGVERRQP